VDCEIRGNGSLGCGEALGDYGAAVDAPGSWWVPEGSGVSENVLERLAEFL